MIPAVLRYLPSRYDNRGGANVNAGIGCCRPKPGCGGLVGDRVIDRNCPNDKTRPQGLSEIRSLMATSRITRSFGPAPLAGAAFSAEHFISISGIFFGALFLANGMGLLEKSHPGA